jgi:hypothetical protein
MNTKQNKIALIRALAAGEVKPEEVTSESIIISDGEEAFKGLMIAVASRKAGKRSPVVFVGKAREEIKVCLKNVQDKRKSAAN